MSTYINVDGYDTRVSVNVRQGDYEAPIDVRVNTGASPARSLGALEAERAIAQATRAASDAHMATLQVQEKINATLRAESALRSQRLAESLRSSPARSATHVKISTHGQTTNITTYEDYPPFEPVPAATTTINVAYEDDGPIEYEIAGSPDVTMPTLSAPASPVRPVAPHAFEQPSYGHQTYGSGHLGQTLGQTIGQTLSPGHTVKFGNTMGLTQVTATSGNRLKYTYSQGDVETNVEVDGDVDVKVNGVNVAEEAANHLGLSAGYQTGASGFGQTSASAYQTGNYTRSPIRPVSGPRAASPAAFSSRSRGFDRNDPVSSPSRGTRPQSPTRATQVVSSGSPLNASIGGGFSKTRSPAHNHAQFTVSSSPSISPNGTLRSRVGAAQQGATTISVRNDGHCCDQSRFGHVTQSPSDCCGQKIRLHVRSDSPSRTHVRIF